MNLSKKMVATAVLALTAASMFYGSAANAASTSVEDLSKEASTEELAIDLYNELSSAADPKQAYADLTAGERAAFDGYFLPAGTTSPSR